MLAVLKRRRVLASKVPLEVRKQVAMVKHQLQTALADQLEACRQAGTDCASLRVCLGGICLDIAPRRTDSRQTRPAPPQS